MKSVKHFVQLFSNIICFVYGFFYRISLKVMISKIVEVVHNFLKTEQQKKQSLGVDNVIHFICSILAQCIVDWDISQSSMWQ